ncbi:hypothetical protein CYR40_03040 [Chimaeribacter arupi]|uniref:Uncharacterized protein n=2 Tax=Yersiniaceae TaxID=1903411 RepID=A0A2N5ESV9_9GAMM|nr:MULTISPECIES: hypothetical protein [Yersiniaceae]MBS0970092.1 hypothetical protein [Nissabacter archeti]MDV5140126.1 hypothetical protein [Chimaeribacter arupi]PLR40119.1 hypothetical protein CYR23_01980 [Chimaeribacter arupi]PLR46855.1 hypothetical protein CYR52_15280 [Chimaeribacter arupi]PLR49471.1 hypothetical protein CYR40_03040 [Chimaeribacter arupi]
MSESLMQQLNRTLAQLEAVSKQGGEAGKRAQQLLSQLYPVKKAMLLQAIALQTPLYAALADALKQGADKAHQAQLGLIAPVSFVAGVESCMAKALVMLQAGRQA